MQPPPDPDANVYDELYDDYDDPDVPEDYVADMYDELYDEYEGNEVYREDDESRERVDPSQPQEVGQNLSYQNMGQNIGAMAAGAAAAAAGAGATATSPTDSISSRDRLG